MRDDLAIQAALNGEMEIFKQPDVITHLDSIAESSFSDFRGLMSISPQGDGLLQMNTADAYSWVGLSYSRLASLAYDPSTNFYPTLCQSMTFTPVHYENVEHVDIDPGDDLEMKLTQNVVYDYAANINEYFLLTSDYLNSVISSPSSIQQATLNRVSKTLIQNLPDAGWDVSPKTSHDFISQLVRNLVEGIMPPISGRELYSKIKEPKLNIDHVSTKINNIFIGQLPQYDLPDSGLYSGGATMSTDGDEGTGWFDPVEVYEYDDAGMVEMGSAEPVIEGGATVPATPMPSPEPTEPGGY